MKKMKSNLSVYSVDGRAPQDLQDRVHVVLASDANYLPGLKVTKTSIERSCRDLGRIAWHLFGDEDLARLDVRVFEGWNCGSKMAYLRLFLPELLPEVDWVVYSDVDVIWNRDVCGLWDEIVHSSSSAGDFNSIYWVKDFRSIATHEKYGCTGVCVMNLKKLRNFGLSRRSLAYVKEHGTPPFADQGILNFLLKDDCAVLSSVWNAMGDCNNLPPSGERCVYHITGVGRHFHDAVPPVYPPQYLLWSLVNDPSRSPTAHAFAIYRLIYRLLAWLWPIHGLMRLLPLTLRERIVRQWFFAKVLTDWEFCRIAIEHVRTLPGIGG